MTQIIFGQELDVVAELVRRFCRNAATFRSSTYNETQTCIEFINPFLGAFGRYVQNRSDFDTFVAHGEYKE